MLLILLLNIQLIKSDATPPPQNPYKFSKDIKHSLFREKDVPQRMSIASEGVPPTVEQQKLMDEDDKKTSSKGPEKVIAFRVINYYRQIFDYLDFDPVDNFVDKNELSILFREFDYPKNDQVMDAVEYAEKAVATFDKNGENKLNFLEFAHFMEDLWNVGDQINTKNCKTKLNKAMNVYADLFKFLDRDGDKHITPEDMIYGVSRIMVRDVDVSEVKNVFAVYDKKKTGKIDFKNFMLAVANGLLKNTFEDVNMTDTY